MLGLSACREEHRVLLHKLLPKAAIDQMRSQINWAHLDDDTSEVKLFDIREYTHAIQTFETVSF